MNDWSSGAPWGTSTWHGWLGLFICSKLSVANRTTLFWKWWLMMIPCVWLCALYTYVQLHIFSLLRSHLLPFWWGNATLPNSVQSVPKTLVVYVELLGCLYSVFSRHIWSPFRPEVLCRKPSLVVTQSCNMAVQASTEYTGFATLLSSRLLYPGSCLATWSSAVFSGSLGAIGLVF